MEQKEYNRNAQLINSFKKELQLLEEDSEVNT